MESDLHRLPLLLTPMVAKVNLYHLIERIRTRRERFMIVRRKQPDAIILGVEDFLSVAGLDQDWIKDAWTAHQRS
jgi:hypothetical protein